MGIVQCLLSAHSGIKLKVSNRRTAGKSQNTWRLNNTPLKDTSQRRIFFLAMPQGLQGFNSPTRDQTRPTAVKEPSPNH